MKGRKKEINGVVKFNINEDTASPQIIGHIEISPKRKVCSKKCLHKEISYHINNLKVYLKTSGNQE